MKVLIVDDLKTTHRVLRDLLQKIGITEVGDAEDGPPALQLLRESKYDLVICDEKMDSMSGLDLLKEIRADSNLQHTPFIVIMATTNSDKISAFRAAGMSHYIVKPFDAPTLKRTIEAI